MKNLFGVFIFVVSMVVASSTVLAGLNDGLVAPYPFSGNANDESGNGNHGTVFGATLATDRIGNTDSAYSFDGGYSICICTWSLLTTPFKILTS